jgi:hypothetical protein
MLNRVWQLCKDTIEVTSLDTFTDSNTRERLPCMCAAERGAVLEFRPLTPFLAMFLQMKLMGMFSFQAEDLRF